MLQVLSTAALMLMLVEGDSPAKRDVYRFVPLTRRPTRRKYAQEMARSDRYTAKPTPPYAQSAKINGLLRMFGREYNIKSDGTNRPTSRRYPELQARGDGWTKYFGKYFTRRPTQRYNAVAASDSRYRRPTQRPTVRRYDVQDDVRKTGRPTKPYAVRAEQVADEKKVESVGKQGGTQREMAPEPEVLDKKYFYVKSRLAWDNAQQACARRGAQLATIHSADEHARVARACQGDCWLGAERGDVANPLKWADDSAMDFDRWTDNAKPGLCAKMSNKEWTSADCDEKLGSVCQKMKWKAHIQANVDEGSYFMLANFARGNLLSLALMITVLVIGVFLASNWICVVMTEKKQVNDMDAARDETTPLLWTKA